MIHPSLPNNKDTQGGLCRQFSTLVRSRRGLSVYCLENPFYQIHEYAINTMFAIMKVQGTKTKRRS